MYRNMIGAASVLSLLALLGGMPSSVQAHEESRLCNVILDGDGEPVRESDSDGIAHANSVACKDDGKGAYNADSEQDTAAVAAPATPEAVVEALTVYFDVNQDDLDAGARAEIDAYVTELKATSPASIDVVGYTDTSGAADLNAQLSKARANSVVAALMEAGLPASLISRSAAGESVLAVKTPDSTREANNRRVVVTPAY